MKWFLRKALIFIFMLSGSSAALATAQSPTPQASPSVAEPADTNALWGGTFVDSLPVCEDEGICLVNLSPSSESGYFEGLVHNNTDEWVHISSISVTAFDKSNEFSAQGIGTVTPSYISPGGHAILGVGLAGEYEEGYTVDVKPEYESSPSQLRGIVNLRVEDPTIKADAILGTVTNQTDRDVKPMRVLGVCFDQQGSITYNSDQLISEAAAKPGESAHFAIPIYSADCSNFVAIGYGYP